jgi:hypothetical protein
MNRVARRCLTPQRVGKSNRLAARFPSRFVPMDHLAQPLANRPRRRRPGRDNRLWMGLDWPIKPTATRNAKIESTDPMPSKEVTHERRAFHQRCVATNPIGW